MNHPRIFIQLCIAALLTLSTNAQTTPMTEPLAEEKEILITCTHTRPEFPALLDTKQDMEQSLGTFHYKLWLPKGYLADPQKRWPCMFIASPGGNAELGEMREPLRRAGFVAVMLMESKNGPIGPGTGNFLAAHDDLVQRVRIQEWLKFTTGCSGGARASSVFAHLRPGFAGEILQAAGFGGSFSSINLRNVPGFLIGMTMGESDENKGEIQSVGGSLPPTVRFAYQIFPGGHGWAPAGTFDKILKWMEYEIYVENPTRPALQPAYAAYFKKQLGELPAPATSWERYKAVNTMIAFARARNLASVAEFAGPLRDMQAESTRLRTDPAIAREVMASESLQSLENSIRRNRTITPAKILSDYRDFAKRYAGTEAGKKADETAAAATQPAKTK